MCPFLFCKSAILKLFIFLIGNFSLIALPITQTTQQGFLYRDYFLYLPPKIDPEKTYWLVVYAHGAQGHVDQDLTIIKYFSECRDCIVVAPTFSRGYQLLKNQSDQRVIEIFNQLKKKYQLHDQFFILGHSAGGQFAHRFTLKYPHLIVGCEACSSGTWATGGVYQSLNQEAETVPIAIGCGLEDYGQIGKRIAGLSATNLKKEQDTICSWTRIEWFQQFERELAKRNFFYKSIVFPGESHRIRSEEQIGLALEPFLLGTSGMLTEEYTQYENDIKIIELAIDELKIEEAEKGIQQLEGKYLNRSIEELKESLVAHHWHFNEKNLYRFSEIYKNFIHDSVLILQKKIENKKNDASHEKKTP